MWTAFIHHFLLPLSSFAIILTVYLVWIRPTIRNLPHIKEFYDHADTFWDRVKLWVRTQWDLIVGTVLLIIPQLPDILQQLASVDMSAFVMSETQKAIQSGIAIALILLRAINLKRT